MPGPADTESRSNPGVTRSALASTRVAGHRSLPPLGGNFLNTSLSNIAIRGSSATEATASVDCFGHVKTGTTAALASRISFTAKVVKGIYNTAKTLAIAVETTPMEK